MQIDSVIPNYRDLGGLPTIMGTPLPAGKLLRSSSLIRARFVQSSRLAGCVPGAIYVDLRTGAEVERHGSLDLPPDWNYRHRPVFAGDLGYPADPDRFGEALDRYRDIVLECASDLVTSPVVVTCSLGKDRTGFVVAALLHILGVRREAIVHDYTLSNDYLARFRFDRPYTLVEGHTCGAWLDFLSENFHPPSATVARLRASLEPRRPPAYLSDAPR